MAFAALVPKFFDISRFEFLRAIHALIVGWNSLMGIVGEWVGKLISLPAISAETINTIVFVSTISVPYAVGIAKYAHTVLVQKRAFEFAIFNEQLSVLNEVPDTLLSKEKKVILILGFAASTIATIFVFSTIYWAILRGSELEFVSNLVNEDMMSIFVEVAFVFFLLYFIIVMLGISIVFIKGLGKGILIALSFMMTLELLYLINIGGGFLNSWACEVLEIPVGEC